MDKTYCVFGDSITQAAYIRTSWVDMLRVYLEKKYKDDFINVFNLGIGGNTSEDILKRFKLESQVREPTDIVIAVGVNDSGYFRVPSKPIVSEINFRNNINNLLTEAKKFTENITFMGLVLGDDSILKPFPDSSQGKSYDYQRVEKYNQILKEIAGANSCKFIELLDKLKTEDFLDGLHPNDQGHQKIFNEVRTYF